jgi:hypothetical protein
MKYLCLVCIDPAKIDALSPAEHAQLRRESIAYNEALMKRGRFIAAEVLKPVDTATTVRLKNGRPTMTDGPFAETKELVGGFLLIEAQNLDEALEIASKLPVLRLGSVEVRATQDLADFVNSTQAQSTT